LEKTGSGLAKQDLSLSFVSECVHSSFSDKQASCLSMAVTACTYVT
jgi:hypothetical protein